ncbi:lyase family protein, partial [Acinetobacter variabilis]|uniref:lyase family protein n=1 Tax=Acinetobacter variabilis TaxID=70346 RepID=UPI0030FC52B5
LSSGPRAGLNESNLPDLQAGSSIMPAKVNPVVPEVVNQVCFKVIGNDTTVTMASEAGQLQLNVMEPVIGQAMFES